MKYVIDFSIFIWFIYKNLLYYIIKMSLSRTV